MEGCIEMASVNPNWGEQGIHKLLKAAQQKVFRVLQAASSDFEFFEFLNSLE